MVLEQMRLRPFISWDTYPVKRGRGSRYTYSNCAVWSNLNGLYFDNKSSPAIYWSKFGTVPEENIPKSAEKK